MDVRLVRIDSEDRRPSATGPWRKATGGLVLHTVVAFLVLSCFALDGNLRAQDQAVGKSCLALLSSSAPPEVHTGLRLGRVARDQQIMEPVLLRKNGEGDDSGDSFRDCAADEVTERVVDKVDLERFESSLVARFSRANTGALITHRPAQSIGYEPDGGASLEFPGTGAMLEARRLDRDHVEVTVTAAVKIRSQIPFLLIASRGAMEAMELEVWDKGWGDEVEHGEIERGITWWELMPSEGLRAHSVVGSFAELGALVDAPPKGVAEPWPKVFESKLQNLFEHDAFSLLVLETPGHVKLAEDFLGWAVRNSADFYLAKIESHWQGKQWESAQLRLEEVAKKGRAWPLIDFYDLAAFMPERVAARIRFSYLQSPRFSPLSDVPTPFPKHHLMLAQDPEILQVANALFRDQAAHMKQVIEFLGCLLDSPQGKGVRLAALEEGLPLLGIPTNPLLTMDVNTAFQHLFQGFSLPPGLRARDRNFLRSIGSGDPEVKKLIDALRSFLSTTSLDPDATCEVALIPDAVLRNPKPDALLAVVPSFPTPGGSTQAVPEPRSSLYILALEAKEKARLALKSAIDSGALVDAPKKLGKGHGKLARGNALLEKSGRRNAGDLDKAIKAFRAAEKIFGKAKEISLLKDYAPIAIS